MKRPQSRDGRGEPVGVWAPFQEREMPTERQICKSPKVNRLLSMASVSLECPLLSDATPRYTPYSHSIVPSDDKALIYQRNFFAARQRTVSPIRQKFALLIPNTSFGDPRFARFQRLSVSIGRFSRNLRRGRHRQFAKKDRQRRRCAIRPPRSSRADCEKSTA